MPGPKDPAYDPATQPPSNSATQQLSYPLAARFAQDLRGFFR
jgi:hypothetical protein